jgi:hypothetical protein
MKNTGWLPPSPMISGGRTTYEEDQKDVFSLIRAINKPRDSAERHDIEIRGLDPFVSNEMRHAPMERYPFTLKII